MIELPAIGSNSSKRYWAQCTFFLSETVFWGIWIPVRTATWRRVRVPQSAAAGRRAEPASSGKLKAIMRLD